MFHLMPTQSGRRASLLWARRTASRGPAENSPASVCSLTLLFKTSSADSPLALRLEWARQRWRCVARCNRSSKRVPIDCCQMPSTLHEMKGVPQDARGLPIGIGRSRDHPLRSRLAYALCGTTIENPRPLPFVPPCARVRIYLTFHAWQHGTTRAAVRTVSPFYFTRN